MAVTLLSNAGATGLPLTVPGGRYVWAIQGTWNGATAKLQALGPDGATYMDVAAATSDTAANINVGQDTALRVSISGGPPSAVFSNLKGVM